MTQLFHNEPMLEMYVFETTQLVEQLEIAVLELEQSGVCTPEAIQELFRIMHTIKGSSAMMLFDNISSLAHNMEDVFYFLRERKPDDVDWHALSDLLLEGVDFMKVELQKIKDGELHDGDFSELAGRIGEFLRLLQEQCPGADSAAQQADLKEKRQYYIGQDKNAAVPISSRGLFKAAVFFEDGCEMENIRAYSMVHRLQEVARHITCQPADILENNETAHLIHDQGFHLSFRSDLSFDEMHQFLMETLFLRSLELQRVDKEAELYLPERITEDPPDPGQWKNGSEGDYPAKELAASVSSMITVHVDKLDKLMDLVGELVIAESMVTRHPELKGLELEQFHKVAHRLDKITAELQDAVMSVRMVSLSGTFQKMNRIVRDMCKKLDKEVQLELLGEETEVDKNIIERISDPLMHLIRNSIDHGIESVRERLDAGKERQGTVTLEARNAGGEVLITVKDDGRGLNKRKILKRAVENNLLPKPEAEMTDKEIYSLIFYPGFSTKDTVTAYSGRGVGMDVVSRNLEEIGGEISVDSTEGAGTTITLKIPLTLAIIDGMNLKVGHTCCTIPITAVQQSFRPEPEDWIRDPDGNEMIMARGRCFPILRLHRYFSRTDSTEHRDGILILLEQNGKPLCLLADELLGQQQVVIKPLPSYIRSIRRIQGLAGCTLLGDGEISLVLDVAGLMLLHEGGR